jgi:hypothetical protein
MNVSADGRAADYTDQPTNQQEYEDSPKHGFHLLAIKVLIAELWLYYASDWWE